MITFFKICFLSDNLFQKLLPGSRTLVQIKSSLKINIRQCMTVHTLLIGPCVLMLTTLPPLLPPDSPWHWSCICVFLEGFSAGEMSCITCHRLLLARSKAKCCWPCLCFCLCFSNTFKQLASSLLLIPHFDKTDKQSVWDKPVSPDGAPSHLDDFCKNFSRN